MQQCQLISVVQGMSKFKTLAYPTLNLRPFVVNNVVPKTEVYGIKTTHITDSTSIIITGLILQRQINIRWL